MRLIVTEASPGKFNAALETGEIIVRSTKTPLADGARKLLERGYNPSTPLTMRHAGSTFDSFKPEPIAAWARTTYTDPDGGPLRKRLWMPNLVVREGQKSGSEEEGGTSGPPDASE